MGHLTDLFRQMRSSAAMDAEPPLPASKRIRSTDKRLGPREDARPKPEHGYKVFVSNLHHKVTQNDISVSLNFDACVLKFNQLCCWNRSCSAMLDPS